MGMIEDLQQRLATMESAIGKLCAKSGHADDVSEWEECHLLSHERRPDYITDVNHQTKCDICGEFSCMRENRPERT